MEDKEIVISIYERYKYCILSGVYISRPFYDMEDLWQDVLVHGLEVCDGYDPDLGAQLHTYLIDQAKWYVKRRVRDVIRGPTVSSSEDFVCKYRDTPLETQEILDKIMVMLPLRNRRILRLIRLGYTYEEIGKTMGVSKQRIYTLFEEVRRLAEKLCLE